MAHPAASFAAVTDTRKTKEHEQQRAERILTHARAGRTMTEIVDLEGLDAGNVKKWHRLIREAGITIEMARASAPPSGLTPETDWWRWRLGRSLSRIRDNLPQIEVSRLVGMTNVEINAATQQRGFCTHDWTVGQLQRLATAQGFTFQEMVEGSFHNIMTRNYTA